MNFLSKFQKEIWALILLVLLFILLRMPSLVEPHWYGDEGIYQVIGKALNSGRILYQEIWDNKPPILYLIYALFNGDQFSTRLISLLVGIFSVIAFYILALKLFKKRLSILTSTFLYVILLGSPVVEGNIANAENFMHLPIILSAFLILKFRKTKNLKLIFVAGLLMSFAFMTKIVAIFEFFAFMLFLFVTENRLINDKFKKVLSLNNFKKETTYLLGFIVFPMIFMTYFISINAFPDFLSGVLSENIDYVGEGNKFVFPMGILLLKVITAIIIVSLLLINRKRISEKNLLISLWLALSLFSTFFSQRPYMHYILMTALPLSYFIGSIIESEKYRILKIIIVILIFAVLYFNFGIYKKNIAYYENYISFMLFNKKIDDYRAFFDANTLRDYEIARFIRMSTDGSEDVFLWSDSGQIYALSDTMPPGKYIVAYHITYYNNAVAYMLEQIEKTQPTYIIKTKESPEFNKFLPSYALKYKINNATIYERQN